MCDLNEIIRTVIDYTWREDRRVPPVVLSLSSGQLLVKSEKIDLERLVSNLFTNALKFSVSNKPITITSGLCSPGDGPYFTVNNFGPVILPSETQQIFERYSRTSSSKGVAGSGLGLYIVRLILDKMGGQIEVTSSNEEGTTFKVSLRPS